MTHVQHAKLLPAISPDGSDERASGVRAVVFMAQRAAEQLEPTPDAAIISIANPGERVSLRSGWPLLLSVAFADACYDESTIRSFGRMWELSSRGFPDKAHAQTIRAFIDDLPPEIERLFIHCGAGVSRSAAVARFACERLGLDQPSNSEDSTRRSTDCSRIRRPSTVCSAVFSPESVGSSHEFSDGCPDHECNPFRPTSRRSCGCDYLHAIGR
jgi:predicted protein tyrosine phosphatase